MKKFITILAVICIVAGCIIGHFSAVTTGDLTAIALEAFGFTVLVINTLKKQEKNTWKEISSVVLFVAGGACCAVAGLTQDTMAQAISLTVAAVALLVGILTAVIKKQ